MKVLLYYISLLIFIALITGFLLANGDSDAMSMSEIISVCGALILYVIGMSLVGEGKAADEREVAHRYFANRSALIGGTIIISLGIFYQLFTHKLDYWLLGSLIVMNVVKIVSLIYQNYRK
jgi:hypothetical protein